jgi:peptide/nickel transport system substrate-binding protein
VSWRTPMSVVAVATLAVLTGCSTGGAGPTGTGTTSLVADLGGYPATFDPGLQYDTDSYSVYRNIYDQLLHRDAKTNEVVPWLATEWKQTAPTTWTFAIRDNVKFSDGAPLTADDVAFSIRRILDPKFASQQNSNFSAIASVAAQGQTLTIKTKAPSPTLLSFLTTLSVVPKAYLEKVGNEAFNQKPIGSGPYAVASTIAGAEVVLKRNDSWWGKAPAIQTVTFRAVPEVASRIADLQSGKAQIATALTPDSAQQIKGNSSLQVLSTPTERVAYLAFNTINGGATNDPAVRKAISLGIDYQSLIDGLQNGYAKPVNSVLTPLATGYPKSLPNYTYKQAEAKALVQQSGKAGQTVVMATSPAFSSQIVQAIQANLQAIGLKVKIQNYDQAAYLKKVQSPDHSWGAVRFGQWSCSCLDADGVAYPLFHTGSIWSSYTNPKFDTLVEKARNTIDAAQRDQLYEQAYRILNTDLPGIGLFQIETIYGASSKLQWKPDAQQSFFVADMSLSS